MHIKRKPSTILINCDHFYFCLVCEDSVENQFWHTVPGTPAVGQYCPKASSGQPIGRNPLDMHIE